MALKPICVAAAARHDHVSMEGVDALAEFYCHRKLNVPNVTFVSKLEFLIRELECKIEYDSLFGGIDFATKLNASLNRSITSVNPIFLSEVLSIAQGDARYSSATEN